MGGSNSRSTEKSASLSQSAASAVAAPEPDNESSKSAAISPDEPRQFPLVEKIVLTHNTRLFRFGLPRPDMPLGLPIGQHISLSANIEGKDISRPYTPTTLDEDLGHFDLVVKVYEKGQMTQYLDQMAIGNTIGVKGPKGRFQFKHNMKKSFGMIAGGTGITPCLQVVQAVLKDPLDTTEIRLIFANVSADDILLKSTLDKLAAEHSNFKVYYVVNQAPEGWTGGVGFVSEDLIREFCFPPSEDTMMMLCGPPGMMKAMQGHLDTIGFTKEMIFKF
eukprot:CAMPEP_0184656218 /NCGR_PEP_ID=MMETSP0308-20130426/15984_1 /TAXON_ID=38269 /ORGANISM="Gloeochaete witrockiana, Strain SAG 46.84" /LENGTH=275 /DNA_ID=CAMNT_0027093219 /DNA_START=141 /DNA_END=968 /DNA_ORIENTATION=-